MSKQPETILETGRYEGLLVSLTAVWASGQRWEDEHRWRECTFYLMGMGATCIHMLADADRQEAIDTLFWLSEVAHQRAFMAGVKL